ncbi:LCP family protein [Streptomyces sp. TRM 70361]|uniref:LCP family protein n=1 Tax=Streptomyces sp. TRM 70361 TaxID=3116553 RepID=UPI002E7C136E|nr:LCP family protein [Streptomyces sp. TRM 70361]MEE1938591.1 LCP family protein [Streptomyces sp. TRM 70361]
MGQRAVRGKGAHDRAAEAGDFGWDDGLYEGNGRSAAPAVSGATSGADSGGGGAEAGPPSRPGHRSGGPRRGAGGRAGRVLRWTAAALSLLILGTAGAGYLYYEHLNGNLTRKPLTLGDNRLDHRQNAAGQTPLNILLLGSDSRNSARNVALGGARDEVGREPLADVQMLLHLSADRGSISVLSIPRDTKVTIPQCTDPEDGTVHEQTTGKINTSLQRGGPGCTVATWMELTGIPIDHFMMIDFAGVVDMADAVGGVPVCVRDNIHDSNSGLRLEAGTTTVRGEQALQWLRTRYGFGDGTDIGRAKAQHMYMNSMVRQLKAGTRLTDPGKLRALAEAATGALTVDEGIDGVKDLYDLAEELRQVPTDRITMATMPWQYADGGSHVVPEPGDAEKVFSLIRDDVALDGKDEEGEEKRRKTGGPAPADPAAPSDEIPVRVRNGTRTVTLAPVNGRAAVITGELHRLGFTRAATDTTPAAQADTTVSYADEDRRGDALAVAKALGLPERAVKHSAGAEEITLVIGADWRQGNAYPGRAPGATAPGENGADGSEIPESAGALNGSQKDACMEVNPAHVW